MDPLNHFDNMFRLSNLFETDVYKKDLTEFEQI